jgi:hypothetical protein
MLKFSSKELNMLYEGLTSFLVKNPDSIKEVMPLLEKLYNTGKVDVTKKDDLKPLNEYHQIGDTVRYDKEKAYVIGQVEGKFLVQVQGSTYLVDEKTLKDYYNKKPELTTVPHMKFNEETQKLLFEKYVRCGVYMGNVPVKLTDCFVKYNQWKEAASDQQVKVLIEGNTTFITKSQIKIYEDLNTFANPDNYVPGVIVDESGEGALENILINAIDYSNAIGDADEVEIIRKTPSGEQERQTMPRSSLRTLTI